MTVIARRIVAAPVRTASSTWDIIVQLMTPKGDEEARNELRRVVGIASSLISDEVIKDSPVVVFGAGPRLRIYCIYGEDAITGEGVNEAALPFDPTAGDWKVSLPCLTEDLAWIQDALRKRSNRIWARNKDEDVQIEDSNLKEAVSSAAIVDKDSFLKL